MAKVSDWAIPREYGLGNELGRYRVKGYRLVGLTNTRQDFELEVTAFSLNQAEMRFRYLFGNGVHEITEIVKLADVKPSEMAEGDGGREKARKALKD